LGNLFYRTDALFLSLEEYRTALHIKPDYYEAQYNLGNVYFKLKKPWRAIIAWMEALILNSKLESARFNIGFAFYHLGEYDDALLEFKRASHIRPESSDTYFYQGMCHFELNQYRNSCECYRRALEMDPDNEEILYNLGNALYEDGHYEEALEYYSLAGEHTEDCQYYNNMADCLIRLGRLDEAYEALEKVFNLKEDFTPARCTLAELLVRQGKTQEAIIEFNRILESSSRVTSDEDRNLLHNYATNMISSLENANSHEGEKV
jgi:tetratricopeptide (TPR) repeat protein